MKLTFLASRIGDPYTDAPAFLNLLVDKKGCNPFFYRGEYIDVIDLIKIFAYKDLAGGSALKYAIDYQSVYKMIPEGIFDGENNIASGIFKGDALPFLFDKHHKVLYNILLGITPGGHFHSTTDKPFYKTSGGLEELLKFSLGPDLEYMIKNRVISFKLEK